MSVDSRHTLSMPSRWKALAIAGAATLIVGFSSTAMVAAQEATPAASPTAECDAPAYVPGGATPEAMAGMAGMATPVADQTVTPTPAPVGTPAEGATADQIMAAADNLVACIEGGNLQGAVALMTDAFLTSQFGSNSHDAAVENLQGLTFAELKLANPKTYDDGSVSIDATYKNSEYQIAGETWHFVQDGEYWKIDAITHFTPAFEGDSAVVGVTLGETQNADGSYTYSIVPNTTELAAPQVLVLHGVNASATMAHEILVFKLPDGADPKGLLDGSIKQSDVEFIGQVSYNPGEQADMVLEGLKPGTYALACFYTGPDGKPHAVDGMITQITLDPAS
jgi:uncharacterized cupredoxin-like copper-binding protein